MKPSDWRTTFTPREWSIFRSAAAKRGVPVNVFAAKYLDRAEDRTEKAERIAHEKGVRLRVKP